MRFNCECMYCGNRWQDTFTHDPGYYQISCKVCKDTKIKVRKVGDVSTDPFGYHFSPEFVQQKASPESKALPDGLLEDLKKRMENRAYLEQHIMGIFPEELESKKVKRASV